MATGNDELRSVRVEVDGADGGSIPDAPEVAGGSGGSPKWLFALGLVVLVAVVAAVFVSRPAADSAADGSQRQAPTTTTVAVEQDAEDTGEAVDETIEDAEPLPSTESNDEIWPTELVADGGLSKVVPGGLGFRALSADSEGLRPPIHTSTDGVNWRLPGGAVSSESAWSELSEFSDGLALLRESVADDGSSEASIFTSAFGGDWSELMTLEVRGRGNDRTSIFQISEQAVFGFDRRRPQDFADFVATHTDIAVPAEGFCEVALLGDAEGSVPDSFELFDCAFEPAGIVDSETVVEGFPADAVLACLSDFRSGALFDLVRWDIDGTAQPTMIGEFFSIATPAVLSDGGMAIVDLGTSFRTDLGACEGLVEPVELVESAVLVADATSNEAVRWPHPRGLDWLGPLNLGEVEVLGQLQVGDQRLAVRYGEDVWLLDLANGAWSKPKIRVAGEPIVDSSRALWALSASGTRAYRLTRQALTTRDFVATSDGTIEIIETITPLVSLVVQETSFNPETVLYADDEVLFIGDFENSWSLEAPPLPLLGG